MHTISEALCELLHKNVQSAWHQHMHAFRGEHAIALPLPFFVHQKSLLQFLVQTSQ